MEMNIKQNSTSVWLNTTLKTERIDVSVLNMSSWGFFSFFFNLEEGPPPFKNTFGGVDQGKKSRNVLKNTEQQLIVSLFSKLENGSGLLERSLSHLHIGMFRSTDQKQEKLRFSICA